MVLEFDPSQTLGKSLRGKLLNSWKGFEVPPIKGDWSLLREHIYKMVCRENDEHFDFFMSWMAQIVQSPQTKLGSAIVLLGEKGTGKSFVFDAFSKIIGGNNSIKVDKAESFTGHFNVQLETALFVQVEEASWGGDKNAEGTLKNLITSDKIMIEAKGRTPFIANNYSRIAITSNEKWVVSATSDERRFGVFKIQNSKQNNHDYFGAIAEQLNDSGYETMMFDLMVYVPKSELGWNMLRNPSKTKWLKEQVDQSKNSIERFIEDLLIVGSVDVVEGCPAQPYRWKESKRLTFHASDLQKQCVEWCKQQGIHYIVGNGSKALLFDEINKHVELKKPFDTVRNKKRGVFWDVIGDWVVDLDDEPSCFPRK